MKIFLLCLLMIPTFAFGLEVDEKLTIRIVKTSDSRKTIMVNRGTEDGLVEGDHARFIVTAGIVARAVCVKVTPMRSVWSVYRLVNADFILPDAVMSLKITPPVKITKDETQAIVKEDTPTQVTGDPQALGIPLADGAQDLDQATGVMASDKELEDLEVTSSIASKNIEVFGNLNVSALASSTETDDGTVTSKNSQSSHHFGMGAELYSTRERQWYSRFSLMGALNLMRNNSQSYNGGGVENDVTEFSGGVNWHPFTLPSSSNEFIPFFHFALNIGTVKSVASTPATGGSAAIESSVNGKTQGFEFGFGAKYYTARGFGVRALLDYYYRSETYSADDFGQKFNKKVSGPRLILGLSYRF